MLFIYGYGLIYFSTLFLHKNNNHNDHHIFVSKNCGEWLIRSKQSQPSVLTYYMYSSSYFVPLSHNCFKNPSVCSLEFGILKPLTVSLWLLLKWLWPEMSINLHSLLKTVSVGHAISGIYLSNHHFKPSNRSSSYVTMKQPKLFTLFIITKTSSKSVGVFVF